MLTSRMDAKNEFAFSRKPRKGLDTRPFTLWTLLVCIEDIFTIFEAISMAGTKGRACFDEGSPSPQFGPTDKSDRNHFVQMGRANR